MALACRGLSEVVDGKPGVSGAALPDLTARLTALQKEVTGLNKEQQQQALAGAGCTGAAAVDVLGPCFTPATMQHTNSSMVKQQGEARVGLGCIRTAGGSAGVVCSRQQHRTHHFGAHLLVSCDPTHNMEALVSAVA